MTAPTFAGQPMHLDQHDLSAAPVGTVVRAADGTIAARYDATRGVVFGDDRPFPWRILKAPAVVLWPQGATKPTTGAERPQALRRACVSGEEYQRLAEELDRLRGESS